MPPESTHPVILHPPGQQPLSDAASPPPSIPWLTAAPWNVIYSTLPMWKSKKNVRITYTALPSSTSTTTSTLQPETETDRLDDLVEYQAGSSAKVSTVRGTDKLTLARGRWAWDWRGNGWLMIASSHWEVLGYGSEAAADQDPEASIPVAKDERKQEWAVTYFAKTLFTPAGIDIYARPTGALTEATLDAIKTQLKAVGNPAVARLADDLFLVRHD